MKKTLELLKKFWLWLRKTVVTKGWLFSFPAAVFALLAFVLHSVLVTIVFALWVLTIILNTNEEK